MKILSFIKNVFKQKSFQKIHKPIKKSFINKHYYKIIVNENHIVNNEYNDKDEYILEGCLFLKGDTVLSDAKILQEMEFFNINILIKKYLFLQKLPNIKKISKNIRVTGGIIVENCPLLKSLPIEVTKNKSLSFNDDQHLTTILSKEQFLSLDGLWVNDKYYQTRIHKPYTLTEKHILEEKIYKEYYSLVKPTIQKQQLLKACTL